MSRWSMPALLVATIAGVAGFHFLVGARLAAAKTPDGVTPAEGDVCTEAGLSGRAWGLCNAYCEAMDCDGDDPRASDRACERVLESWERQADGETIPCEPVECPCWSSSEEVASLHASNLPPGFGARTFRWCSGGAGDSDIGVGDFLSGALIVSFVSATDASCATELHPRGTEVLPILWADDLKDGEIAECREILQGLCH